MRLIDAEALKIKTQKIKAEALEHGFAPESVCGDILLNFLDNAPTIEAKPIVHAHWEKGCDDEYIVIPWWTCSHCGKGALTKKETIYDQVLTDYCPYCGAQMDEFASDNNVGSKTEGVKIPVISMEDVPKIMEEKE